MFKPSSSRDHDQTVSDAGDRSRAAGSSAESSSRQLSAEEHRKQVEAALEHVNRKFGRALRKLAE